MLKIKEIRTYCNQKLPKQATGTCSACPAYSTGLDLMTLVEKLTNPYKGQTSGLG